MPSVSHIEVKQAQGHMDSGCQEQVGKDADVKVEAPWLTCLLCQGEETWYTACS